MNVNDVEYDVANDNCDYMCHVVYCGGQTSLHLDHHCSILLAHCLSNLNKRLRQQRLYLHCLVYSSRYNKHHRFGCMNQLNVEYLYFGYRLL